MAVQAMVVAPDRGGHATFPFMRGCELIRECLLRSTKAHLDLPFVPAASAIGGDIQAIHEVVLIRDEIVLSNRRARRFRVDCHVPPVHCDGSGTVLTCFRRKESETFKCSTMRSRWWFPSGMDTVSGRTRCHTVPRGPRHHAASVSGARRKAATAHAMRRAPFSSVVPERLRPRLPPNVTFEPLSQPLPVPEFDLKFLRRKSPAGRAPAAC